MENLLYTLIFLYLGWLPWITVYKLRREKADTVREYNDIIRQRKENIDIKRFCQFFSYEFQEYLNHIRTLRFEDKPNYSYLRQLFENTIFLSVDFKTDPV